MVISNTTIVSAPITLCIFAVFPYLQLDLEGRLSGGCPTMLKVKENPLQPSPWQIHSVSVQVQLRRRSLLDMYHAIWFTQHTWPRFSFNQSAPSDPATALEEVSVFKSTAFWAPLNSSMSCFVRDCSALTGNIWPTSISLIPVKLV